MKSLTKKLLGIAIAATMVFACGATTLAAPAPDAQPLVREASVAIPCNQFNVGDTIEAGTTVSAIGRHSFCYLYFYETMEDYEAHNHYNKIMGYDTWTADAAYLVVERNSGSSWGGWCDLYLILAPDSSETSETSLTPEQLRTMTIETFVESLYVRILDRTYDPVGRDYWLSRLMENGTATTVVSGFLNSAEFSAKNMSNEEFVAVCYSVFCNRTASAAEVASWVDALNNGATRADVVSGFATSPEWATICGYFCVNV